MVKVTITKFEGEQFDVEANTVGKLKEKVENEIMEGERLWWLTQAGCLLVEDENANLENVLVKGDGEDGYQMQLSKKIEKVATDDKAQRRFHVRTDKTRFIVTGTPTKFKVYNVKEERDDFFIKLSKTFRHEEEFGIVTNDLRPGQEPGQRVQATFYKIPEEGEIHIETRGENKLVHLITTNNRQGRVLNPEPLEGTEDVWDRGHIITPLQRMQNRNQLIGVAVGAARSVGTIATQIPA